MKGYSYIVVHHISTPYQPLLSRYDYFISTIDNNSTKETDKPLVSGYFLKVR